MTLQRRRSSVWAWAFVLCLILALLIGMATGVWIFILWNR